MDIAGDLASCESTLNAVESGCRRTNRAINIVRRIWEATRLFEMLNDESTRDGSNITRHALSVTPLGNKVLSSGKLTRIFAVHQDYGSIHRGPEA